MKDYILAWIEKWSSKINGWAWDKRFKTRDPNEWVKEYRKWKDDYPKKKGGN
jgi:hypothetical protein